MSEMGKIWLVKAGTRYWTGDPDKQTVAVRLFLSEEVARQAYDQIVLLFKNSDTERYVANWGCDEENGPYAVLSFVPDGGCLEEKDSSWWDDSNSFREDEVVVATWEWISDPDEWERYIHDHESEILERGYLDDARAWLVGLRHEA